MSATITAGYPSFDPSIGSGYISNGELLAWLSEVTGDKWDEMRELMMSTDARHEVMDDLNKLRTAYQKAGEDKDTSKLGEVLQELKDKYAGTQYETAINELVDEPLRAVQAVYNAYDELKALQDAGTEDTSSQQRTADNLNNGFVDQLDTMGDGAERMVDKLGKDDQMTLISIQDLQSNITQQVSLASNLIKSDDQAKSAIIMNLKG
jgi:molybdopterin converting factor small subunit